MRLEFGFARGLMWAEIVRSYGLKGRRKVLSRNGFHYPVYSGCRFYRVWRFLIYVDLARYP